MKIQFTDKILTGNRPDLEESEKITGVNINQIKTVVNTNDDSLTSLQTQVNNFSNAMNEITQAQATPSSSFGQTDINKIIISITKLLK